MMNVHSLCAYPFIASPIFNAIIQGSGVSFDDPDNEKLKISVKEFVTFKLTKS